MAVEPLSLASKAFDNASLAKCAHMSFRTRRVTYIQLRDSSERSTMIGTNKYDRVKKSQFRNHGKPSIWLITPIHYYYILKCAYFFSFFHNFLTCDVSYTLKMTYSGSHCVFFFFFFFFFFVFYCKSLIFKCMQKNYRRMPFDSFRGNGGKRLKAEWIYGERVTSRFGEAVKTCLYEKT
ncbi:hypothetical protein POVWA2_087800 [Plasmodium ovale wallikeri]|uniref:Uncharacterized protein n=1 Tax=Plasmodium ovale wallikeri TaxID=864142 RepID=A0A1A9ARP4_PLAOA|nr:hypothetical protein POVWA2_087800 [Plasmodium ovale wallikeri]